MNKQNLQSWQNKDHIYKLVDLKPLELKKTAFLFHLFKSFSFKHISTVKKPPDPGIRAAYPEWEVLGLIPGS